MKKVEKKEKFDSTPHQMCKGFYILTLFIYCLITYIIIFIRFQIRSTSITPMPAPPLVAITSLSVSAAVSLSVVKIRVDVEPIAGPSSDADPPADERSKKRTRASDSEEEESVLKRTCLQTEEEEEQQPLVMAEVEMLICQQCTGDAPYITEDRRNMARHMVNLHDTPDQKWSYQCTNCPRKYKTRDSLNKHIREYPAQGRKCKILSKRNVYAS